MSTTDKEHVDSNLGPVGTTRFRDPIVSAAHLASQASELSEFEFGLTIASNAFQRWMVRCMAAAGGTDMGGLDVLVLHQVNHRQRAKRLSDICFVLNVEDNHTVSYALKKLTKQGLVHSERKGKESFFSTTEAGQALCERYRQVRETCLVGGDGEANKRPGSEEVSELAKLMRALSGLYDQAARAASSF